MCWLWYMGLVLFYGYCWLLAIKSALYYALIGFPANGAGSANHKLYNVCPSLPPSAARRGRGILGALEASFIKA